MELPKTPIVDIQTTNNRGFTPEEISSRCVDKIVEVGDNAAPEIRDQARAFKSHLEKLITFYIKEAIKSCLLYTSPSPRDVEESRMPSSA